MRGKLCICLWWKSCGLINKALLLANSLYFLGDQERFSSHSGCCCCCLGPSVASTHNNDIVLPVGKLPRKPRHQNLKTLQGGKLLLQHIEGSTAGKELLCQQCVQNYLQNDWIKSVYSPYLGHPRRWVFFFNCCQNTQLNERNNKTDILCFYVSDDLWHQQHAI